MSTLQERPPEGNPDSGSEPQKSQKTPKRAALSSWIGSALEYYDFAVYGTAAALVVNELFFPEGTSPGVAVLASMATVGIAYVVRPFGALIMGPLADRFGRRFVLMLSLFMIGISTFLVGCLPTYDQVGILAPALLALCRIVQGISASGEQGSAIAVSLEHADEKHRSWTTAWTLHGTQFGTLLATAVFIPFTAFLSDEALMSWGWRVPFWLSAFVMITAWMIRRHLEEPPAFKETVAEIEAAQEEEREAIREEANRNNPLRLVLKHHRAAVIRVAIGALVNTVNIVFTVWALSFATSIVGLDRSTMLWVTVIGNVCALVSIPLSGSAADRFGRKKVFITGAIGAAVMMYPYLAAVNAGNWTLIFIFGAIMFGLFYSMSNATWPALYAEMFPTSVRVTGVALGTQIGFALSGGFAPVLASLVAGESGENYVGVAIFTTVVVVLISGAIATTRETAFMTLDEIDADDEFLQEVSR
ncbi:MAG TPA: MHS family MFS transporter [Candidatus Corynebacterium avicola]|uniref:MHS family MFS transporter n=1 Tax=Candidatus Corynebacterium avicola TaxID=2838527 RepID=A0A9D1RQP2_9CORY|nr:MHS family MFS transporter [Candidatus Corynebacterium avicola]